MKQIYLVITQNCNYHCSFCIRDNVVFDNREMDYSTALPILDELSKKVEGTTLVITGGEPFLYPNWLELVSFCKQRFPRLVITSNGSFSKVVAEQLKSLFDNNVRLQLSLDGTRDTHDAIRGKGAFDRLISNLNSLEMFSDNITISTSVGIGNINDVCNLAELLNKYKFGRWKLSPIQVQNPLDEKYVQYLDWNKMIDQVLPICKFKVITKKLFDFELFDKYLKCSKDSGFKVNSNCGFGLDKMYILPNFDVLPCSCVNEKIGNIENDGIENVLKELEIIGRINISPISKCFDCKYKSLCNGGCPGYSKKCFGFYNMGDIRCPLVK